ncbi:MAG: hypothetical protein A2X64_06745 [Ignavibacteria bacterium GWF2_33_9]|nr:MAG: hypothetical protein A2X64_06745 [Ignavibacteria bacterium GWF2_33_9]
MKITNKLPVKNSKVNIKEKLELFHDYWNPRIVGELNGQYVKLAKFKGEFIWHKHEHEDELFLVIDGEFDMEFPDKTITVKEGEFLIVSAGVEHRSVARKEVSVLVFEPQSTINTGEVKNERTKEELETI